MCLRNRRVALVRVLINLKNFIHVVLFNQLGFVRFPFLVGGAAVAEPERFALLDVAFKVGAVLVENVQFLLGKDAVHRIEGLVIHVIEPEVF